MSCIKRFTWAYRGIQGFSRGPMGVYKSLHRLKGIQEFTVAYRGIRGFIVVYKSLQGYTRV